MRWFTMYACVGAIAAAALILQIGPASAAKLKTSTTPKANQPSQVNAENLIFKILARDISLVRYATPKVTVRGTLLWGSSGDYGNVACTRLTVTLFKCTWATGLSLAVSYAGDARVVFYKYAPDVTISHSTCYEPGDIYGTGTVCIQFPPPPNG